ncbi:MAG: type I DNA topoisomerase, partial [Elusimicrobia bacterium]|nr:type I DNA topoisomerase [Elusimicrobiota bacterium]
AWHLKEALKLKDNKVKRITFNEITKDAIQNSVKNPRELDMGLVDSQQARRILDRIVGYKLSPLLWKKVKVGLSAGRVQSVAVMLVCDREAEIQAFIPQEYWSLTANLHKDKSEQIFEAGLVSKAGVKFEKLSIKNKQEADEILKDLKSAAYSVKNVESKERRRAPYPPYTTSTMQQDASRRIGFFASKTMQVAQKLYEGIPLGNAGVTGLITYMRTDSLNIAKYAQGEALNFIAKEYGEEFKPAKPRFYKAKAKGAQEAHEAIRPTSVSHTPESVKQFLTAEQFKLYSLIWKRFVASQMTEAVFNTVAADIEAKDYIFRATGSTLKFEGFLKVYAVYDEDKEKEAKLPELKEGEKLNLDELKSDQHFTEPPARYNEASLIKTLEEYGIGRPSTYAPTIKTILDRLYVRLDGKKFLPTPLGIVVNNVLKDYFKNIVNVEFTAKIEEELDDVAEQKAPWQNIIKEFYTPFNKDLEHAEQNMTRQKVEAQKTDELCPKCNASMVIRDSRRGQFMACSAYPECKTTFSVGKDGKKIEQPTLSENETCPKCSKQLVVKQSWRGPFIACSGYPDCKTTFSIDKDGNKVLKPEPEVTDIKCEKCGKLMLKRVGKRGPFIACPGFPKCRNLKKWTSSKES